MPEAPPRSHLAFGGANAPFTAGGDVVTRNRVANEKTPRELRRSFALSGFCSARSHLAADQAACCGRSLSGLVRSLDFRPEGLPPRTPKGSSSRTAGAPFRGFRHRKPEGSRITAGSANLAGDKEQGISSLPTLQAQFVVDFRVKANCFASCFGHQVDSACQTARDVSDPEDAVYPRLAMTIMPVLLVIAACSSPNGGPTGVPIADLPLTPDGIGEVDLGLDPESVVDQLTPLLGGPSGDTGWLDNGSGIYGDCPLPLRVVTWGSLSTFHTGGPTDGRFFAYSYGFDFDQALAGVDGRNLNLTTPDGIGLGSTVAQLNRLGLPLTLQGDATIDVWTFAIEPQLDPHLEGQLTGVEDDDTVLFIETSTGCD